MKNEDHEGAYSGGWPCVWEMEGLRSARLTHETPESMYVCIEVRILHCSFKTRAPVFKTVKFSQRRLTLNFEKRDLNKVILLLLPPPLFTTAPAAAPDISRIQFPLACSFQQTWLK